MAAELGRLMCASLMSSSTPPAMRSHHIRQGSILPTLPPASRSLKGSPGLLNNSSRTLSSLLQLTAERRQAALERQPPSGDKGAGILRRYLHCKPLLQLLHKGRGGKESQPQAAAAAANSRRLQPKQGDGHRAVVRHRSAANGGAGCTGEEGCRNIYAIQPGEHRAIGEGEGTALGMPHPPHINKARQEDREAGLGAGVTSTCGAAQGGAVEGAPVEVRVRRKVEIAPPHQAPPFGNSGGSQGGKGGGYVRGTGRGGVGEVDRAKVEGMAGPGEGESSVAATRAVLNNWLRQLTRMQQGPTQQNSGPATPASPRARPTKRDERPPPQGSQGLKGGAVM